MAHLIAAGLGILLIPIGRYFPLDQAEHYDLRAVPDIPAPDLPPLSAGRVRTITTYRIGQADRTEAIRRLHEIRNSRYRSGALSWDLLEKADDAGELVEVCLHHSPRELIRGGKQITRTDYDHLQEVHDWLKERGGSWTTTYAGVGS
jgi:hypothetical protein